VERTTEDGRPPDTAAGTVAGAAPADAAVFPGDSDMAARCRALDWAATPLGPVEAWPAALRAAVRLTLAAPVATSLWVGPEYTLVYNDAYARILSAKHPAALGRSGAAVWDELWPTLEPQFEGVRGGGRPVFADDALLRMERLEGGRAEDAWFTYALSPLTDEAGACLAVYNVAVEVTERTRAERARDAERARAASILEAMTDAYFALDHEFRIVAVNAAMERSTGLARDALLGRLFWEMFPGTVGTAYERHYRAAATEGAAAHFTNAYSDGRLELISEADVYPVAGGGVAVFWRDITARVQAEAERDALLAAERAARAEAEAARAQSEAVLGSIADPFILLDREWRITQVNDAAEPPLQTGRSRLLGRTLWDAFPGLEGSLFEPYYRDAMSTGRPTAVEDYFAPLDTWFDVHIYPWPGGLMVHFRDVSARKAAEAERERLLADLRGANAELRRVTAAAQAGERRARFLADLGHALQPVTEPDAVMEAAARLLGEHLGADRCAYAEVEADEDTFTITGNYTRGDTIGILGRFTFRAFGAEVLRLMRANEAYVVDDAAADPRVTPPDRAAYEQTQIAAVICVPLHKAGRFAAAMAVHQRVPRRWTPDEVDLVVTVVQRCWESLERARALRRLRESEAALRATSSRLAERTAAAEAAQHAAEAANRAKAEFLATMSHELRTPINAVLGYASLLEVGVAGPLTEQQRGYLERLTASGRHLLGLVSDVLDLAKVEAGAASVAHEEAMTGSAVRAALDLVAPAAAARGIRLVDAGPAEAGVLYVGDEDRVRQILVNLLSNAVKFTAAGGIVTVTSDTVREAPPAATHLKGAGPWAYVRVEDTGVGIPPEEQGRIFEEFHQVQDGKNPYTRTVGGTGLGLAISRRLARLMGGDLSVESAPGVGSAFTLWLPASRRDGGASAVEGETAADRTARAERDVSRLEAPGLGEVGEVLHGAVADVLTAYTDRLRADPAVPEGSAMTRLQLEDHAISFLADLAQSLVIVGDAGPEAAELLKAGSAIQRTIAEEHGARRHAQGWAEPALRRDQQVFREEVERAVRARLKPGSRDVDEAMRVLLGLMERGEAISVRAWRRAAADAAR
jgi:PAS domain S-box-containing protein